MIRKQILFFFILSWLLLPLPGREQKKNNPSLQEVIASGDDTAAMIILSSDTSALFAQKNFDSLISYIPDAGRIARHKGGDEKAFATVFAFIHQLALKKPGPALLIRAYRRASQYFEDIGSNKQALIASQYELQYALQAPGTDSLEVAQTIYKLGVYAHRMGELPLAEKYLRRSLSMRQSAPHVSAEEKYLSYNSMGALLWYMLQYDSADVYYNLSLKALASMPENDLNRYYRTANVYNNIAALYSAQGKTSAAITAMNETIKNFQQFLSGKPARSKKADATAGLYQAIDNLAGIYQEVGDYGKAGDLLFYSYHQKLKKLDQGQPDLFISEILLGQHYNRVNDYDKALVYLNRGLTDLANAKAEQFFWEADGNAAKAMAFSGKKLRDSGAFYYAKSQELYETAYAGDYDNIYMDFLRQAALFYAHNGYYDRARADVKKVYDYLVSVKQDKGLQGFYQLLNMAEIEYLAGNYGIAREKSDYALTIVTNMGTKGSTLLDSAKIELYKPQATLIQVKSNYALQTDRSISFLSGLSKQLDEALRIIERRKVLIDDAQSINVMVAANADLISFAKKIQLELLEKTGDEQYLDGFINLHESGIYNQIRSNFDKEKAVRFANLPPAVQEEEQRLKTAMQSALQSAGDNNHLISEYITAVQAWNSHLELVRKNYPGYYTLRYASIVKALPQIQSSLPAGTTLVRYYFSDSNLVALVADSSQRHLIPLGKLQLETPVNQLLNGNIPEQQQLDLLYQLYSTLWQPFENNIHTEKVIVIPDGILFNIGFDMLARKPMRSFATLSNDCLLSQYAISYHYSLFMLDNAQRQPATGDYIAFVPGFSDQLKQEYRSRVPDSVNLDFQYLSLLPQPNTVKLARKISTQLRGTAYTDNASTEKSFVKNAAGHKIIHIGTHAEFNNNQPERSRLIFAKDIASVTDTNSLYLADIYNCNISSDLTILTACESGRPGLRDGEGMISLAHAFNYAGSNMILTGLWKLDEPSSNMITEFFIKNLLNNLPADEALRQAKLNFLQKATGRMRSPAYWAGIVLMGKPESILLHPGGNFPWSLVLSCLSILTIFLSVWFFRSRG